MRIQHITEILDQSIDSGRGARTKNLKVYVRFFSGDNKEFLNHNRQHIENGKENEFQSKTGGYEFYFDLWDWGIVVYHTLDPEGTRVVEGMLKNYPTIRKPWIKKNDFYNLSKTFIKDGGKISVERALFAPYEDYSGYGIKIEVRGRKTEEVIGEIEQQHALHPRKIGIEIGKDENLIKFEMTNTGRLSFSTCPVDMSILIIGKYVEFLRQCDEKLEYKQSRRVTTDDIKYREMGEVISLKMPSLGKIRGTIDERNAAILNLFTKSQGYIGMPIGDDRANVLDLKERKLLQITIGENKVYVYTENPSEARSAIRRFIARMASYIDPDIEVEKLNFSGE